jgi:hypothetical protein
MVHVPFGFCYRIRNASFSYWFHGTNLAPDNLSAKAGRNFPEFQPHKGFCVSESKGSPMKSDIFEPEISHDGGRLPVEKVIHDAAADVEEGLEFWKTIAGKIGAQRHASREFLNRRG